MPNYGNYPYEEAAAKGQARMSLLQRIGQAFAGAGYGIAASQGAQNPIEALGLGFAGSYGKVNAARQAAEEYARKKIEAQQAQEYRNLSMKNIESEIAARAKKPEAKKTKIQEAEEILGRPLTEDEKKMTAGVYQKPETASKPSDNIAGMTDAQFKIYLARKKQLDQATSPEKTPQFLQEKVRLINQMNAMDPEDRALLQEIIANPPTPEEATAARQKLEISPGYYRRPLVLDRGGRTGR